MPIFSKGAMCQKQKQLWKIFSLCNGVTLINTMYACNIHSSVTVLL